MPSGTLLLVLSLGLLGSFRVRGALRASRNPDGVTSCLSMSLPYALAARIAWRKAKDLGVFAETPDGRRSHSAHSTKTLCFPLWHGFVLQLHKTKLPFFGEQKWLLLLRSFLWLLFLHPAQQIRSAKFAKLSSTESTSNGSRQATGFVAFAMSSFALSNSPRRLAAPGFVPHANAQAKAAEAVGSTVKLLALLLEDLKVQAQR